MKIKRSVLFVCMGNICRSPTAEGVARGIAKRRRMADGIEFDSAGTHGYHTGNPPDPRARQAAEKRGYDLSALRARQVNEFDFTRFDLILAMDQENLDLLRKACPKTHQGKLRLFLEFAVNNNGLEVPDPYYGGPEGFERVLDMVEDAANGLISHLERTM